MVRKFVRYAVYGTAATVSHTLDRKPACCSELGTGMGGAKRTDDRREIGGVLEEADGGEGHVHAIVDDDARLGRACADRLESGAREFEIFSPGQIFFAELNPVHAGCGDGFDRAKKQRNRIGRSGEREAAPVRNVAENRFRQRGWEEHGKVLLWTESD